MMGISGPGIIPGFPLKEHGVFPQDIQRSRCDGATVHAGQTDFS